MSAGDEAEEDEAEVLPPPQPSPAVAGEGVRAAAGIAGAVGDAAGALTSEFFFARASYAARFSAIRRFCSSESSSPTIMPICLRWSSTTAPISATMLGM